jgi:DNA-binding NarL/FixJ family response regulator
MLPHRLKRIKAPPTITASVPGGTLGGGRVAPRRDDATTSHPELTSDEVELLSLLAQGLGTGAVGRGLQTSERPCAVACAPSAIVWV